MSELCVNCGKESDGFCESCEAPLCYDCDSGDFEDVLECADEDGCSARIDLMEATK